MTPDRPATPTLPRLLLLTDRRAHRRALLATVTAAVQGGARAVVLREKDLPDAERRVLAASLCQVLDPVGGRLLVAGPMTAPGAGGCHLAAADALPTPRPQLLGRSCHDPASVRRAVAEGCDYLTVSPVAPTSSKPGYGPPLGADGLRRLVEAARDRPVYALGGVTADNATTWCAAGAAGVAVMGAVMGADDPAAVTAGLLEAVA